MDKKPGLIRRLPLPLLVFHGIGTILGAGTYVLLGKVAGKIGEINATTHTPLIGGVSTLFI